MHFESTQSIFTYGMRVGSQCYFSLKSKAVFSKHVWTPHLFPTIFAVSLGSNRERWHAEKECIKTWKQGIGYCHSPGAVPLGSAHWSYGCPLRLSWEEDWARTYRLISPLPSRLPASSSLAGNLGQTRGKSGCLWDSGLESKSERGPLKSHPVNF